MNPRPTTSERPPGRPPKHGLIALKRAVRTLGGRVIDRRTTLGKALAQWRGDLIADLGGRDAVTTQQAAVIDLAVKTKLLLDSIDAWLLTQPSLINKNARAVWPVVRERQTLADALARYMTILGLERRVKTVTDLHTYVARKYSATETPDTGASAVERPRGAADQFDGGAGGVERSDPGASG